MVDTCPPQVMCDRHFMYDAVVLLVPAAADATAAPPLHVFGHVGMPLELERWSGELPAHVQRILDGR